MKNKFKLDLILGIRPDVIRSSILINKLRRNRDIDLRFIWSGQHYSKNLKDIFFKQLNVSHPDLNLNCKGNSDSSLVSSIIKEVGSLYETKKPNAAIFLGDTNTVMASIAAAQNSIPIVHIEGCMRSYDWRMPEEKYRTVVDHLSDIIYAYFDEYKSQGIREGIRPDSIIVTQNLIVDVLNEFYFSNIDVYNHNRSKKIINKMGLEISNFYIATIHRRENIESPKTLRRIFSLFENLKFPIIFIAGYRTQDYMRYFNFKPKNTFIVDPIGYSEILTLISNSDGVITDSGTLIEECSVIGIPSIQTRTSTERPQVYDTKGCLKFDPLRNYLKEEILNLLDNFYSIEKKSWKHNLGDGLASQRIYEDLINRIDHKESFNNHSPSSYHIPIQRSYINK